MLTAIAAICATPALVAQTAQQNWRRIGNSAVEIGLASPASGPVSAAWFSADGSRLYARTQTGRTFVSSDMETWSAAPADATPRDQLPAPALHHFPEKQAVIRATRDGRAFALGSNVYRSDDGGLTWTDLTGYDNKSVIGGADHDLAVSPLDPQLLVVANDSGIWRSNDGGLSWSGLNENLPNLAIHEITGSGLQIAVSGMGTAVRDPGSPSWRLATPATPGQEDRAHLSGSLGVTVTALNGSGDTWYAGSSDGRLWVSTDRRVTWTVSQVRANGPIERIYSDPEAPRIAFAAAAGAGAHLFRTINSGLFWDDITGSLSDSPAHGIAADRTGGAVYAATDSGVYVAQLDLNALGAVSAWTQIPSGIAGARAMDVRLDATGANLLVALDGYGLYTTALPRAAGNVRLVNAADLSQRAAAPGSLYSVLGAQIQSARSGTSVFPVLAAEPAGSQIQVPFDIEPSQVTLTVQRASGPVSLILAVKQVSPAIFLDRDGAPIVLDAYSGLMLDANTTVHSRSRVQLLATGLGRVKPEWPSGIPAPAENPPAVAANVDAYLNGVPVQVTKATLAPGYVGLYVVEIQLPAVLDSGIAELYLSSDGQESNRVRISIDALN